ncbi:MAG: TRAP transporter large permease [Desulforegulaceae bacterium]|nr:TRAP transporter large permease [Desulforegulaceae bacterium]
MSFTLIGIIGVLALFVLIFLRMPVGFAMLLTGVVGFAVIVSPSAALAMMVNDLVDVFGSYSLTVIPLFILMGQVAFHAGISTRLFSVAHKWIGHLPGGMAIAAIGACAGFSAICGSTNATAATMAAVTLPEMKKYKYSDALATGVIAAGGSLGILIPPSVIFIVYGIITEQSIGDLFMAGIIPGVVLTLLFSIVVVVWSILRPMDAPRGEKHDFKTKIKSLTGVLETILLFILVMGGLFGGLFTPTEAAGVGSFGTIILAVLRRNINFKGLLDAFTETTRISCMILMIVAGATVLGHFLAITQIPFQIAGWVGGLDFPSWAVISIIILIYVIGGCFIDALALIMLTVPIFYPVVIGLGYNPVWFGVVIVLVTQIGVITPPVGINVYVVRSVATNVRIETIFRGVVPLLFAIIAATALLLIFPSLALFLPEFMAK